MGYHVNELATPRYGTLDALKRKQLVESLVLSNLDLSDIFLPPPDENRLDRNSKASVSIFQLPALSRVAM